jgi:hypothetical protein
VVGTNLILPGNALSGGVLGLQLLARTADSDASPRAARVPLAALFLSNPEPLPLHIAILAMTAFAHVKVTKSAITVRLAPEIFFEPPTLEQPCP